MTTRVMLISPAISRALREARFDDGTWPLDAAGERTARAAVGGLPPAKRLLVSPTARCHQTAEALELPASEVPALAGLDVGRWRGRTLDEVSAAEPDAVAKWLSDPAGSPHGGESLLQLHERIGTWLEEAARVPGQLIAVVEPDVIRAATVQGLGLPEAAFWRLDVPPLAAVELSGRADRWNLRVGVPLGDHQS
jgi:broad specificity phosphatase PhoE